jgi:hypothetical protein
VGIANETPATQLHGALAAGVASISASQSVPFTQYTKVVLSQDGYVFWVASSTVQSFTGSLHYMTDTHQDEDQTLAVNRVIFTAPEEVTIFNSINPQTMWVGTWQTGGGPIQVAFSERGSFYKQAGLWHYSGYAVYPALSSQLVASPADLPTGPIVSNSLPIWLAQNQIAPVYPSFLVPDNVVPPYVVAHIEPSGTVALGAFPILTLPGVVQPGSPAPFTDYPSSQLMRDDVRLTLYGFTNQQAIQYFVDLVEFSTSEEATGGAFGFCNSPAIRDEKRTQTEITAIAMKKTIEIQASYYIGTADAYARRHILSAAVSTTANPAGQTTITVTAMQFGTGDGSTTSYPLTVTV